MARLENIPHTPLRLDAPPPPAAPDEDRVGGGSLLRLIRRRLGRILLVGALVMAVALPGILNLDRRYYAESRLLFQSPLDDAAAVQLDLTTEIERLASRAVAERVIAEFHLDEMPEFNPALRPVPVTDELRAWLRSKAPGGEAPDAEPTGIDRILPEYYAALALKRDGVSQVIRIGFSAESPALAAEVANALRRIYLEEREGRQADRVAGATAYLDRLVARQRDRVARAEQQVAALRAETGVVAPGAPTEGEESLSFLAEHRTAILREKTEVHATLRALETAEGTDAKAALLDQPAVAGLWQALQSQRTELLRLRAVYGEGYDGVQSAEQAIQRSEADLAEEIGRQVERLKGRLAALEREDSAVTGALQTARTQMSRDQLSEVRLGDLMRVEDREKAQLEQLEERLRLVESQAARPSLEAEVLSPASVPLSPVGHGRLLYLMGAMIAAGMIGLTLAVVADLTDTAVRSHAQLSDLPELVPAGFVPRLPRRAARRLLRAGARPDSLFSDSLRGVMLAAETAADGQAPRSLVVTSALPGEGVSLVARALALEYLRGSHRVLLVECEPHGSPAKGRKAPAGLADVIAGRCELAEAIRSDPATGLDLLSGPEGQAALFHDRATITRILQHVQRHGQIVIFDAPPVLATSDTALLSGLVDRTLLVVRWGRTRPAAVEAAARRLQAAQAGPVLAVINGLVPRRHALYGYPDAEQVLAMQHRYRGHAA